MIDTIVDVLGAVVVVVVDDVLAVVNEVDIFSDVVNLAVLVVDFSKFVVISVTKSKMLDWLVRTTSAVVDVMVRSEL